MGRLGARMPPRASWSGSLLRRLLDQPLDGRGGLRTYASPICQAIKRNANAFFCRGCNRIVKTDALYEAAIARARPRVLINTRASRASTAHTQLSAAGLANVKSMGFMATSSTVSAQGVVPPRSRETQSTVTEQRARPQCQNLPRPGRGTASSGAVPWWSFQVD